MGATAVTTPRPVNERDLRRCIYCLEDKPASEFNAEHVLNQAFGRFENNLTLDCVCTACNQAFGDTFDRKLARDSVEAIARVKDGVHPAAKFKGEGKRSTTTVRFDEGPLQGALAHYVPLPGGEGLGLAPLPQVGFAREETSAFEWYPLGALPTKGDVAEALRLQKGDRLAIQIQGTPFDLASAELEAKGFVDLPALIDLGRPTGVARAETSWIIGSPELRAVTKIAMNYLASSQGASIARMVHFNDARRFVLVGTEPSEPLVQVMPNPWSVDRDAQGHAARGHYFSLHTAGGQTVIAQVCLFLRMRYVVTLARGGFALPMNFASAHFFDTDKRVAARMPPLPLAPPAT